MWQREKGKAAAPYEFNLFAGKQIVGFAGMFLFIYLLFHPSDSAGNINLLFSASNYGLHGDGPGDSSSLLIDATNTLESCHLITRDISPVAGRLNIAGTLGINAPGSDADNAFEPNGTESWTFYWDRNVVLNSLSLIRIRLASVPATSPMVLTIRSEAWLGKEWAYTLADTNRVYNFDSITGTFTFTGFPTNTESQTRLTFAPAEVFQSATLGVMAGASVTLRNEGLTWAGIRGMEFQIVPEPQTGSLTLLGLLLFIVARRAKKPNANDPLLPGRILPSDYLGQKAWRRSVEVLRDASRQLLVPP